MLQIRSRRVPLNSYTEVFEAIVSLNELAAIEKCQLYRILAQQTAGSVIQEYYFNVSHNVRRQKPFNFGTVTAVKALEISQLQEDLLISIPSFN